MDGIWCFRTLSIVYIVYGVLGLFGIQNIPEKVRGTEYEREYKIISGKGWLIISIPYLIFSFLIEPLHLSLWLAVAILIILGLPGLVFSFVKEREIIKKIKN